MQIGADKDTLGSHAWPPESWVSAIGRGRAENSNGNGTGYAVDCLRSAVTCLEQPDYERAVRMAIRMGHDTDTTACVVGGLAGMRYGLGKIPQRRCE